MTSEDRFYPDLEADGLGELKKIQRLPSMRKVAPNITWGEDYLAWPLERRLRYAERLASTMNHAADELQKDRNRVIDAALHQEAQLTAAKEEISRLQVVMNQELAACNAREQTLATELVNTKQELKAAKKELERLQETYGPLD